MPSSNSGDFSHKSFKFFTMTSFKRPSFSWVRFNNKGVYGGESEQGWSALGGPSSLWDEDATWVFGSAADLSVRG